MHPFETLASATRRVVATAGHGWYGRERHAAARRDLCGRALAGVAVAAGTSVSHATRVDRNRTAGGVCGGVLAVDVRLAHGRCGMAPAARFSTHRLLEGARGDVDAVARAVAASRPG